MYKYSHLTPANSFLSGRFDLVCAGLHQLLESKSYHTVVK